jgi:IclR family acetate operon transcriptional repressor
MPVKSVEKALDLLEFLALEPAGRKGATLTELAGRLGAPPNTTHALVRTLVSCGFAGQAEDGRYEPGRKCLDIGRLNRLEQAPAHELILEGLHRLAAELEENCMFTTLSAGERLVLARADADRVIKVDQATAGRDKEIFELVTGRVLVSFASPEEREAVIERHGWPGSRWEGIRSRAALAKACSRIRNEGHLLEATKDRLVAIACPVLSGSGACLGAIGSYAPAFRCGRTRQQVVLKAMKQTAAALGKRLCL